jgi:hypothetical protein
VALGFIGKLALLGRSIIRKIRIGADESAAATSAIES